MVAGWLTWPSRKNPFADKLPSNYPLEIIDSQAEHKLAAGLFLSVGSLTTNNSRGRENQGFILEAEILLPNLDPTLPLALQVDLVGFSYFVLRHGRASVVSKSSSFALDWRKPDPFGLTSLKPDYKK